MVRPRAEELLMRVGLEGKGDAYPSQLSGGQQQRGGDREGTGDGTSVNAF